MSDAATDDGPVGRWRDVIARSSLPVLLLQISTRRVVAESAGAANLLGPVDTPNDLMTDPEAAFQRLSLLEAGVINGYRIHTDYATSNGARGGALFDVNRPETPGAEDLAIVVVTPDKDLESGSSKDELARIIDGNPAIEVESPVLLGMVDRNWQIMRVSHDLVEMLGHQPEEVIGTPFTRWVDRRDVGNLLIGIGKSFEQAESVAVRIQIKRADGGLSPFIVNVIPFDAADGPEFAFVARPVGESDGEPAGRSAVARAAELEHRLWRIALEVQAAGVVQQMRRMPDLQRLPGINDLSTRQLEVLTRLLDGERVPGIARAMFVSQSTVRNHLGAIFRRLGVHSQAELLARVHELDEMTDQT